MNRFITTLSVLFLLSAPLALAQQQQEPDMDKVIAAQLDNLTRMFKLDEVQVFFVDSILQHNYPAMAEEMNQVRKTGANNTDSFQAVSDKWMDATDKAFQLLFTEQQWQKYMKSAFGKEKLRRDKRISERGGIH